MQYKRGSTGIFEETDFKILTDLRVSSGIMVCHECVYVSTDVCLTSA
jgi:hypothetical protein